MKNICLVFFSMLSLLTYAQENTPSIESSQEKWTSSRPDGHSPISVMGDHVHHKGEWMFGYRFMTMEMNELYDKNGIAFDQSMAIPKEMTMNMHMIGAMYAPSDKLTLMLMANYSSNQMSSTMHMEMPKGMMHSEMEMETSGFGDISLSALYQIFNKNRNSLHATAGVIFPTGSIDEWGTMQMMQESHDMWAYGMQPGSGSFSTKLGLTYLWQNRLFSAGAQGNALLRLNDTETGYRLGNEYGFTSWLAIKTTDFLSFSLRGNIDYTESITGKDARAMPMMSSSANIENSGGVFAGYGLGANFMVPRGPLGGLRFGVELNMPLYQEPNGIQLKHDYALTLGTQYSF